MQPRLPASAARQADPARWCGGDLGAIDKFWRSGPRCRLLCSTASQATAASLVRGAANQAATDMRGDLAGVAVSSVGTFMMATPVILQGEWQIITGQLRLRRREGGGVMF